MAYIKSTKIQSNGSEVNANPVFVARVRDLLRDTNPFHEVIFVTPPPIFPYVEISFIYSEAWTENQGLNFPKTILAAASLGLLAPVMVATADYACDIQLKVWRPDGQIRECLAHSSGEAKSSLNNRHQKSNLVARVITNNLNSVMSQLVDDKDFYRAKKSDFESGPKPPI